jgi:hypothetical protein
LIVHNIHARRPGIAGTTRENRQAVEQRPVLLSVRRQFKMVRISPTAIAAGRQLPDETLVAAQAAALDFGLFEQGVRTLDCSND